MIYSSSSTNYREKKENQNFRFFRTFVSISRLGVGLRRIVDNRKIISFPMLTEYLTIRAKNFDFFAKTLSGTGKIVLCVLSKQVFFGFLAGRTFQNDVVFCWYFVEYICLKFLKPNQRPNFEYFDE